MGGKANDWWIRQDGDKDFWLEKLIGSRDLKWLSQTSQTSGQGMKNLVKDHLSCAVILQNRNQNMSQTQIENFSLLCYVIF